MASLPAPAPLARPMPVMLAVILSVLLIVTNLVGFALPTNGESVPAFVIISTIVLSAAGVRQRSVCGCCVAGDTFSRWS